jgi:hypothetical protein
MSTPTVHELAETIADAIDDTDTPAWVIEDSFDDGDHLDDHTAGDICHAYVKIDGRTFSLTVQEVQ